MKRILVLSDTHGSKDSIKRVFSKAEGEFHMFLHMGDHYRDAEYMASLIDIPYIAVRGNCDYGDAPVTDVLEVMGNRIFLTHGHSYYTTDRLSYAAAEQECKYAIYGHTHCSEISFVGGITVINPGSPAKPRDGKASFAVLRVEKGKITPEIISL